MRLFHPFQTESAPRWLLELEPLSGHGKQPRLLWYLLKNSELRRCSVTRCSQKAPRPLWVAVMLLSGLPDRKGPKRAVHVVRGHLDHGQAAVRKHDHILRGLYYLGRGIRGVKRLQQCFDLGCTICLGVGLTGCRNREQG